MKSIVADRNIAYAVLTDGTTMAWESNKYGLLGIGSEGFDQMSGVVPVQDLTNVDYISIGLYSTHALLGDGTVATWGMKDLRNMGQEDVEMWTAPQIVENLSNVTSIDTGIMGNYAVVGQ